LPLRFNQARANHAATPPAAVATASDAHAATRALWQLLPFACIRFCQTEKTLWLG
jgi:hypothetical protein